MGLTEKIEVMIRPEDKATLAKTARLLDMTMSEYIRWMNQEAKAVVEQFAMELA